MNDPIGITLCILLVISLVYAVSASIDEARINSPANIAMRQQQRERIIADLELRARKGDLVAYQQWKEMTGRNTQTQTTKESSSTFFFIWW